MQFVLVQNGAATEGCGEWRMVPWWSVTKAVIATAALVLVRDERVALDEPLPGQPFTLRQLLRHEAGLVDYGQLPAYHEAVARRELPWIEEEMLVRADAGRLRYAPGEGWSYSNIGYLHVRRLLEHHAGQELGAALRRLVLDPLGIEGVRLAAVPADLGGVEMGAAADYDPRWVYHGLLVGPLVQAALFLDRMMSCDLLPPALRTAMLERRAVGGPVAGRPWVSPGYGLGLMTGQTETGLAVAGHTGGGPGSFIAVYRKRGLGFSPCCAAFSTDSDQGSVERRAMAALEQEGLSS